MKDGVFETMEDVGEYLPADIETENRGWRWILYFSPSSGRFYKVTKTLRGYVIESGSSIEDCCS